MPLERTVDAMKFGDDLLELRGRKITMARIISRLTPAPIFNLYIAIILVTTSPIGLGPILTPVTALVICIVFMVMMPLVPIVYSAWQGKTDLDVSKRTIRVKFFIFSLFCYAGAYLVYRLTLCHIMEILAAAYFGVTTMVMLLTFRTKVSVHAAGVSGPGTALIYIYGPPAITIIIVWIAVVWARKTLQQHTIRQGILGVFSGILVTFFVYLFLY